MTNNKPTITVRYAVPADQERINQFCFSQFLSSKEYEVKNFSKLSVNKGMILIAEMNNTIISTIQAEIFTSYKQFTKETFCTLPDEPLKYMTLHISKSATVESFRNSGLEYYLRQQLLKAAMECGSIKTISAIDCEFSSGINEMRNIGCSLKEAKIKPGFPLKPLGKVFIISLERSNFEKALDKLNKNTCELVEKFELVMN